MAAKPKKHEDLQRENQDLRQQIDELRSQLGEAQETLRAIREGEVDALVVSTVHGERIFTLQGADESYRTIVEQMQEGAVTIVRDGTIQYSNARFADMVGKPLERVIGSSFRDHVVEADRPRLDELLGRVREGSARGELYLNENGGVRTVPVYLGLGAVVVNGVESVCVVVTDLTERKRVEEILASERYTRAILNQAADAIVVFDRGGRLTFANPAARRLAGLDSAGTNLDIGPEAWGRQLQLDDDGIPEEEYPLARALKGEATSGHETRLMCGYGREYDVLISASPLQNIDGDIIGAVGTFTDITALKQAQDAMRRANEELQATVEELRAAEEEIAAQNEELQGQAEELSRRNQELLASHATLDDARLEAVNETNRLAAVMEALPVGVAITDAQGGDIRANRAFEQIWGGPRPATRNVGDYAAYKAWWPDTEKPVQPGEWASARAVQEGETVVGQLMWIQRLDGDCRFVINSAAPIRDSRGRIVGSAVAIQDITEHKRVEAALERSLRRFELLATTAGELLRSHDPQNTVERLCRTVMDYLDCQCFLNFLTDPATGRLHLNACAGISEQEAKKVEWLEFGVAVCGCVARDGRRVVAEHIPTTADPQAERIKGFGVKAYAAHPLLGPGGEVLGTLAFGTRNRETFSEEDLTVMAAVADQVAVAMTRMHGEQALRESERFTTSVAEASPNWFYVFDLDSMGLSYMNRPILRDLGFPPEVQSGVTELDAFRTFMPPEEMPHLARTIQEWETLADGCVRDDEYRLRHVDGTWRHFAGREVVFARRPDGTVRRILGSLVDVTARKRAEEALRDSAAELARSNEDLEQFAYVASHDLQEPLRMVTGYMHLLKERYAPQLDPTAAEFVGFAADGATRMSRLIDDLLTYSRVGTRGGELKPTDCQEAMTHVLQGLQLAIEDSHAVVTHDPLPTIRGDATQIRQLFQNLIANALKFHGTEPPRIHVGLRDAGAMWEFSVSDNGIGMEARHFDRVFMMFQRLHTRESYPGTGIGLAICRKIAERHGGSIRVESKVGQGSTFFVSLPKGA